MVRHDARDDTVVELSSISPWSGWDDQAILFSLRHAETVVPIVRPGDIVDSRLVRKTIVNPHTIARTLPPSIKEDEEHRPAMFLVRASFQKSLYRTGILERERDVEATVFVLQDWGVSTSANWAAQGRTELTWWWRQNWLDPLLWNWIYWRTQSIAVGVTVALAVHEDFDFVDHAAQNLAHFFDSPTQATKVEFV